MAYPSNLRVGDYLLPFDSESKKVFVQVTLGGKPMIDSGSDFGLLGGGRNIGESGLDCLVREIKEETEGRLILDVKKIKFVGEFITVGNYQYFGYKSADKFPYQGKLVNIYTYPLAHSQLSKFTFFGDEELGETYDWVDRDIFVKRNQYIKSIESLVS